MPRKAASTIEAIPSVPKRVRSVNREAAGLDPAAKAASLLKLRRARGQVEGVERMIQSDRSCTDIILQITAARASLQLVAKDMLTRHLNEYHGAAQGRGGAAAEAMHQELVELVSTMSR